MCQKFVFKNHLISKISWWNELSKMFCMSIFFFYKNHIEGKSFTILGELKETLWTWNSTECRSGVKNLCTIFGVINHSSPKRKESKPPFFHTLASTVYSLMYISVLSICFLFIYGKDFELSGLACYWLFCISNMRKNTFL